MEGVLERIQELCKKQGTNIKTMEISLGFSNGTVGKWKSSKDVPYSKITAVAKYLNTTPAYILYGEDPISETTTDKYFLNEITAKLAQEMRDNPALNTFMSSSRKLSPEQFEIIQDMIFTFLRRDGKIDD